MIDKIVGYCEEDLPIYSSDLYPYTEYIGYEDRNGNVILY